MSTRIVAPGGTIGIFGGGQLGHVLGELGLVFLGSRFLVDVLGVVGLGLGVFLRRQDALQQGVEVAGLEVLHRGKDGAVRRGSGLGGS